MIRVCHFCTSSVDAPYFRNISRGLVADGMSVLVGNLAPAKPPAWLPEVPGVRHFDLGAAGRAGYPGAVVRLARLLRRERVDILQTHLFDAGLVGVAAGRLARTPTVLVTRHHSDQAQLIGAKFHMALDRWTARMADGVVAVSHATRDFMVSHDPSVAGRVEVVHLGFDFAALSPTEEDRRRVREEFGFGSDFVLAFVSNFFKTKGHRYLLAALAELAREIPEVRLLLLGDGDRAPLDRLITELGLGGRV
ncbi:MAG TPA: glycosyltransferase, partial [Pyrinomonadaceae bacterium]